MESKKRLSVMSGALLLVNTMFGAGVVAVPTSFIQLGYVRGLIILIATAVFTFISLIFLAYAAEVSQNFSYSRLCKEVGRPLSVMLDLSVVVMCYGCTICYGLSLIENIRSLLPIISKNALLYNALIAFLVLAPLFFLSRLRSLDKLSFGSVLTFGATVIIVLEFLYYKTFQNYTPIYAKAPMFNKEYAKGLTALLFSFGCQQNAVTIYSDLKNRRISTAIKTMGLGCILGGSVYMLIGYLGSTLLGCFDKQYDSFLGAFVNEKSHFLAFVRNVTWDKMAILPRIPVYAFILVLFSAFPVQTFAARNSLFNLISDKIMSNRSIFVVTLIQFVAIYCFMMAQVKSMRVLSYIGAIACPLISFVFPSVIYMKFVGWRKISFYLAVFMVAASIGISGYSLTSLIIEDIAEAKIRRAVRIVVPAS